MHQTDYFGELNRKTNHRMPVTVGYFYLEVLSPSTYPINVQAHLLVMENHVWCPSSSKRLEFDCRETDSDRRQ